jgi:hypothetical protein
MFLASRLIFCFLWWHNFFLRWPSEFNFFLILKLDQVPWIFLAVLGYFWYYVIDHHIKSFRLVNLAFCSVGVFIVLLEVQRFFELMVFMHTCTIVYSSNTLYFDCNFTLISNGSYRDYQNLDILPNCLCASYHLKDIKAYLLVTDLFVLIGKTLISAMSAIWMRWNLTSPHKAWIALVWFSNMLTCCSTNPGPVMAYKETMHEKRLKFLVSHYIFITCLAFQASLSSICFPTMGILLLLLLLWCFTMVRNF